MSLIEKIRNFLLQTRQEERSAQAGRSLGPLRSIADLDALLSRTGGTPAAALVHRVARSCFHILPDAEQTQAAIGGSRLGGAPDLAVAASWPRDNDGTLLTFFGQINLEDLPKSPGPSVLPARGLLSIFGGPIESISESIAGRAVVSSPEIPLLTQSPPDGCAAALEPVRIRFEAGLSFPVESSSFLDELELAAPACDIDALIRGFASAPKAAIGQILGYAQFLLEEVHSKAYFAEIGRDRQERLLIWENWEAWEAAKNMSSRLANGQIYRPWSAVDDENVRWILANKEIIASGIEKWHSVIWIDSNPLMNLWINDADPIYFLAKVDDGGLLDLSNLRAGATQS
jgi:hypothetical protein